MRDSIQWLKIDLLAPFRKDKDSQPCISVIVMTKVWWGANPISDRSKSTSNAHIQCISWFSTLTNIKILLTNEFQLIFDTNTQFRKKRVFHKILQKKVEGGPYPKSNQVMPMPMGISCRIFSQIGPPVLELACSQAFLTF